MYERWGKRLLDIGLAGAAMVVLSPVLALAGLAILIEDGRPVLFKQERPGRGGRPFRIYKFRSMATSAKELPSGAIEAPPVTKVGRVIRRLNVDELPQLINIVMGDMSIVGPRPPLAAQAELLALRSQGAAIAVRPGLTGLAQVNSYDGMSDDAKAAFDNAYAERITLRQDLRIIAKTFGYLLHPPPKY